MGEREAMIRRAWEAMPIEDKRMLVHEPVCVDDMRFRVETWVPPYPKLMFTRVVCENVVVEEKTYRRFF